ncbi:eed69553-828b-454f-9762-5ed27e50d200-CDS [Sclerotinia trifoliorum]|uniref:Eed69553-828b-454f-9762-5ed27e50d200-CDS n=1 Tax=Sclerotinia trifoliorum TaxID=28548 RepID=A0A8H2ZUR6_9HELO|nr:eed69553-828b-454f-9762-5ed27e50d200-CDS [Sclerotinia trifoliorum]
MTYDRPRSRGYFERDRNGHERIIFRSNSNSCRPTSSHSRRSTSQPRTSSREIANELEERNAELHAVTESLRIELAVVETRNWQLNSDNSALRDIVRVLKGDKEVLAMDNDKKSRDIQFLEGRIDKLEGKREKAEVRGEKAEERVRMMRRGLTGRGILSEGGLKERLEDKIEEVERLQELLRVMDAKVIERNMWLAEKDNKLGFLRRWLVARGFHVEGV